MTPRSRRKAPSRALVVQNEPAVDPRKESILSVIRATGLTPRQAAISSGVPAPTYYRWVDDDRVFREAIAEAEATFERRMARGIVHIALSLNSWRAMAWILEHRLGFSERWTAPQKVDLRVAERDEEDIAADRGSDELDRRIDEIFGGRVEAEVRRRMKAAAGAAEPVAQGRDDA